MKLRKQFLDLIGALGENPAEKFVKAELRRHFLRLFKDLESAKMLKRVGSGKSLLVASPANFEGEPREIVLSPDAFGGKVEANRSSLAAAVEPKNAVDTKKEELYELAAMGMTMLLEQFRNFKEFRTYVADKHDIDLSSVKKNSDAYEFFRALVGFVSDSEEE